MDITKAIQQARTSLDEIGAELKVRKAKKRQLLKSEMAYISDVRFNTSLAELNQIEHQIDKINDACEVLDGMDTE